MSEASDHDPLDALREALGPADLQQAVLANPALRARELADLLLKEGAAATDPTVREHRAHQAAFLQQTCDAVDAASRITSLHDRLRFDLEYGEAVCGSFWDIISSVQALDPAVPLTDALNARRELERIVDRLNASASMSAAEFTRLMEQEPVLCDPLLHQWLQLRLVRAQRLDLPEAVPVAALRDRCMTYCRTVGGSTQEPADTPGRVRVRTPTNEQVAEGWWLFHTPLFERKASDIARLSTAADVRAFAAELAQHDSLAGLSGDELDAMRGVLRAAFLEYTLRAPTDVSPRTLLDEYSQLIEAAELPEARATMALRFGTAVVTFWPGAYEVHELEPIAELLTSHLRATDQTKSPRLKRDLHFTLGRILEHLGRDNNELLTRAASSYEAGLGIEVLAHERLGRARALGDLANARWQLAQRGLFDDLELIDATYTAAIPLVPEHLAPANRGVIEGNYAAFLMERPDGDRATNSEKAVQLAQLAIQHLTAALSEAAWVAEALANAHITLANAIRSRVYGEAKDRIASARDLLKAGIKYAREGGHVRGLLRLNQGFTAAQLATLVPARDAALYLDEAERCLDEARDTLAAHPIVSAIASFARAVLALRRCDSRALDEAVAAVDQLERLHAYREASWRLQVLAQEAWRRGDLETTRTLLLRSLSACERLSDRRGIHVVERALASLLLQRASSPALEEARKRLHRAADIADCAWRTAETVEQQLELSDLLSAHGELAWVLACSGDATEDVAWHAHVAKNLQLALLPRFGNTDAVTSPSRRVQAHLAIREALAAEALVWEAQANVGTTESIYHEKAELTEVADAERVRGRLLGFAPPTLDRANLKHQLDLVAAAATVLLDFTITPWGALVVRIDDRGTKIHTVDQLAAPAVSALLEKLEDAYNAWKSAHVAVREQPRQDWATALRQVLEALAVWLEPVLVDATSGGHNRALVVIPGLLGGLPLTALPFQGAPLVDHFSSVTYAPTIFSVRPDAPIAHGEKAACVLSDGDGDRQRLDHSPGEATFVASGLAMLVDQVDVVAVVGQQVGRAALGGPALPVNANVLNLRPTPSVLADLFANADIIFYSGHGHRSGLCLTSADGTERQDLRIDQMLATPLTRAPVVLLSACSTAQECVAWGGEAFSLASWFLRAGARFVVGGLWEVGDQASARFSSSFVDELLRSRNLPRAYAVALRAVRGEAPGDILDWTPFVALTSGSLE